MPRLLSFEPMHAITTSTSFRHSRIAVLSLGMPSIILVLEAVVLSRSGNNLRSLDSDRTKILSARDFGGWERRQRKIADPVEPVAPSRAYVGIFE
jgi:hypothetical protein